MPEWRELVRKQLAELNLAPEREAEIVEEFSQHAEDRYQDLKRSGLSDAEAERLALSDVQIGRRLQTGCAMLSARTWKSQWSWVRAYAVTF